MLGRTKPQSPEEFKANLHKGQNIANARKAEAQAKDEVAAQRAKNGGKQ